jgi:hypothetical protein
MEGGGESLSNPAESDRWIQAAEDDAIAGLTDTSEDDELYYNQHLRGSSSSLFNLPSWDADHTDHDAYQPYHPHHHHQVSAHEIVWVSPAIGYQRASWDIEIDPYASYHNWQQDEDEEIRDLYTHFGGFGLHPSNSGMQRCLVDASSFSSPPRYLGKMDYPLAHHQQQGKFKSCTDHASHPSRRDCVSKKLTFSRMPYDIIQHVITFLEREDILHLIHRYIRLVFESEHNF